MVLEFLEPYPNVSERGRVRHVVTKDGGVGSAIVHRCLSFVSFRWRVHGGCRLSIQVVRGIDR